MYTVWLSLTYFTKHAAAAAALLQSCPTLCDPIDSSPPGSHPWDSPGKNTGVGCHFLLQCMKVKSESEVAQICLTCSDPMDCSLPGSSIHGIFQARVLEWGAIAFSDTLQIHPCCCKWQIFILFYDWVVFLHVCAICIPYLLYLFICWWTLRLLPNLGNCK